MPAVKSRISDLNMGTFPAPLKLSSRAGATTQANTPIGSAAAAQTPRILATEYCLIA